MIIGYLTSQYARASDTFIRGEVRELRRLGHTVRTYSIRRSDEPLSDPEAQAERQATRYVLLGAGSVLRMLIAVVLQSLASPRRMIVALRLSFGLTPKGIKARLWQLAYVAEASVLVRLMRKAGVQHIHDHIGENSGTVAMLASLLSGTPFSMTIHGPGTFYAPERWSLGTKIRRSAFTVCISQFCRSQCMVWSDPGDWEKLKIVHCGIDGRFLAPPAGMPGDCRRLICVGRLCAEKGQLLLVEAAARLKAEGHRFEIVLVGDGPMRGRIEQLVRERRSEDVVRVLGWMSRQQVREAILASRSLVLPSFAEGLPVVIMEALALGRPVISTYIAGIPELVENGKCGWLVPAGSIDALVDAMRAALDAPVEQLVAMGREGARRVAERHDAAKEARKLAELFAASIRSRHAVPGSVANPHPQSRLGSTEAAK